MDIGEYEECPPPEKKREKDNCDECGISLYCVARYEVGDKTLCIDCYTKNDMDGDE